MSLDLPTRSSDIYVMLKDFRTELILYMMATTRLKPVKKAISHYYNQLRTIEPAITGKDLIRIGLKPSPLFKQILESVLEAKLNGQVETIEDEMAFVRQRYI